MSMSKSRSILAIVPGTRHLGFGVFSRGDLVKFGVKPFDGDNRSRLVELERFLNDLALRYSPSLLVLKDPFHSEARHCNRLSQLTLKVKHWARAHHVKVMRSNHRAVKAFFCTGKKTRKRLADAMVERYWFLYTYLKAGRHQPYWQQMFDAVALGAFASLPHSGRSGKPVH